MPIPWGRPVLVNSIPTPINPLSAGDKLFKAGLAKLRMSREVPKLREELDNRKGIPCAGKSPLTARDLMDMIKANRENTKTKKKQQLKKNNKIGKQRENEVKLELEMEGHTVIGSQVSVKTKYTRRIIDHLIKEKGSGDIKAIEVKSGGATRNKMQVKKDNSMELNGGKIIGKNAPSDLKDKIIKIKTEVRN